MSLPSLGAVVVALLIGLLIGLDRERAEARKERALFAGVRTFPLVALVGALATLLVPVGGAAVVVTGFLGVAAIAVASYVRGARAGDVGATTEIAALVTFLLGALAAAGQVGVAAAAGVMVAVLLAAKPPLEALSRALTSEELVAVLQLAVITVIVLPLLPDRGFGPWEVLNPRRIWLLVILVSSLSFAGFVAMRLLGPGRGIVVTGAVGGLVSSTALTLAMAERSRATSTSAPAAAVILASIIMCVRLAVLAGAMNAALLPRLLPVIAAMALTGGVAAWLLLRTGATAASADADMRNPFSLAAALGFAAVFSLVLLVTRAAQEYFGNSGLYATAVLSGIADVDAPTLAFARLSLGAPSAAPVLAIVIAAVTNTLAKAGLAAAMGHGPFRRQVVTTLGATAAVGLASAGLVAALW